MAQNMSFPNFDYGFKRSFRWIFSIPEVCGWYPDDGLNCKLHEKTNRPNITIREIQMEHLGQTIYMPGKVAFEPVSLTLWDTYRVRGKTEKDENPVWKWLNEWYDYNTGTYKAMTSGFKKTCNLKLYDGCGCAIEHWVYENAWPQSVNFNEVDMGQSSVLTIDLTLKYDLAYLV